MKKLHIICMNGWFGFRIGRRHKLHNLLEDVLQNLPEYQEGIHYDVWHGRGSIFGIHNRRLRRYVARLERERQDETFLFVGKSYGVRNIVDYLHHYDSPANPNRSRFVCFFIDGLDIGKLLKRRWFDVPKFVNRVINFYQRNSFLKGVCAHDVGYRGFNFGFFRKPYFTIKRITRVPSHWNITLFAIIHDSLLCLADEELGVLKNAR